jgi:hypothetical protein
MGEDIKKESVKKPEAKKNKKYIGKSIHFFYVDDRRYTLKPNALIPANLLNCEEVKRLAKDKKVIDV